MVVAGCVVAVTSIGRAVVEVEAEVVSPLSGSTGITVGAVVAVVPPDARVTVAGISIEGSMTRFLTWATALQEKATATKAPRSQAPVSFIEFRMSQLLQAGC